MVGEEECRHDRRVFPQSTEVSAFASLSDDDSGAGNSRAWLVGAVQLPLATGGSGTCRRDGQSASRTNCADADYLRQSAALLLHTAVDIRAHSSLPAVTRCRKAHVDLISPPRTRGCNAARRRVRSMGRLCGVDHWCPSVVPRLQMVRGCEGSQKGLVAELHIESSG